ncbi:MAG: S1 RNA-binding domain-containing protein, partial [Pontiellaceae bacterium]|nr:S1 RNA-binding domain-containing protein [Pontiellaceae bacterium]
YKLVEQIASDLGEPLEKLIGNIEVISRIKLSNYVSDNVGELTLVDIVDELKKPGRDPREKFEEVGFREDVMTMQDLKEGMELKGVVTNVTAFGAFVDIGVHQDGLVHISQLSDRFIKDPAEVVQAGDRIDVRVLEVDLQRKRISLTAKKNQSAKPKGPHKGNRPQNNQQRNNNRRQDNRPQKPRGFSNNPFADL